MSKKHSSIMDAIRKEFKLANFGLSYENVDCFVSCQWRWRPCVFLAYRIILALYVTIFFIVSASEMLNNGMYNFMAYLTMWTYFMLALYLVSSASVALFYKRRVPTNNVPENTNFARNQVVRQDDRSIPNDALVELSVEKTNSGHWVGSVGSDTVSYGTSMQVLTLELPDVTTSMKITWVLGNVVQSFVPVVTVVYFTALFPLIGHTNFTDINLHGVTLVFMLIDTCITARPVRLLHIIHPTIYGLCYIVFSLIYWGIDHSNVLYPGVLDWNYPGLTMIWVAGLAVVALPLLQLLFFGLFRLRLHFYKRRYGIDYIQL